MTNEDDEYSGGWGGDVAHARQLAMKDALRVALGDFLTALRNSDVEFAAVHTDEQTAGDLTSVPDL